jgi:hypothetical protein
VEHYSFELPTSAIVKITNATCLQAKEFNANVKDPAQKAETIVAQMDGSMVPIVQYSDASQEQRLAGLKKKSRLPLARSSTLQCKPPQKRIKTLWSGARVTFRSWVHDV